MVELLRVSKNSGYYIYILKMLVQTMQTISLVQFVNKFRYC